MRNLRVDGSRLWDSLMELAQIGALPNGGVRRLAFSDEDKDGRDLFIRWCEAAGCSVTVDAIGNIFARRKGRNEDLAPVMTGSHLDTQPHGGRFDGAYGVLAGLEVLRALDDAGIETEAPVEVVAWSNEEGARFAPSMMGSGAFAGAFSLASALAHTDGDGAVAGEELTRIGYAGPEPCGGRPVGAYFEVHIEQGPILEGEDKTIGVVTGGQGIRWYDVHIKGQDSHAGTTPMDRRRDCVAGAGRLITEVREIARARPPGVGTVGVVDVVPGSRNTISGETLVMVDMRHPDAAVLTEMDAMLKASCAIIAQEENLEIEVTDVENEAPVRFDGDCVGHVRDAAEALGYSHRDIASGAGHDAFHLSKVAPAAMIFIPCKDGLSHTEIEDATPDHVEAGCNVLLHAVLARAGVAA